MIAMKMALAWLACSAAMAQPPAVGTTMLLADDSRQPTVEVSWPTKDGSETRISGARPYASAGDKSPLGKNVEAYVALGGSRFEKGQGDPKGQLLRVGLYKRDPNVLFFNDLADVPGGQARIVITLKGVFLNQPAVESRGEHGKGTALAHLKYSIADLTGCGLDATARNQYLTADPDDPVKQVIEQGSGRWGSLDCGAEASGEKRGCATVTNEPDGSLTVRWEIPYLLLRHMRDPYERTVPGGFFEPPHFHVEIEVVPKRESAKGPEKLDPGTPGPRVDPAPR